MVAFVLLTLLCQARADNYTAAGDSGTDNRNAAPNLDGACTDDDEAGTNATPSEIFAGFAFLRRIDERLIKAFDKAWQVSGDGTTGREGVVLIFRTEDGSYRGISQGFTSEYERFTFSWKPNALAIVHTHPNRCDPTPSSQDKRVADTLGVPIFTITIHGMFVYNPATRATSKVINDLDWLKLSKWQQTDPKLLGRAIKTPGPCSQGSRSDGSPFSNQPGIPMHLR